MCKRPWTILPIVTVILLFVALAVPSAAVADADGKTEGSVERSPEERGSGNEAGDRGQAGVEKQAAPDATVAGKLDTVAPATGQVRAGYTSPGSSPFHICHGHPGGGIGFIGGGRNGTPPPVGGVPGPAPAPGPAPGIQPGPAPIDQSPPPTAGSPAPPPGPPPILTAPAPPPAPVILGAASAVPVSGPGVRRPVAQVVPASGQEVSQTLVLAQPATGGELPFGGVSSWLEWLLSTGRILGFVLVALGLVVGASKQARQKLLM